MEQLYHFLFHLRMTMYALAEEPIGKKSQPSNTAVGQMLTNLPRRAAFVRSAETVGVIYTDDTPKPITNNELIKRIQAILLQTRKKYCHPRAEVERLFWLPGTNNQQGSGSPDIQAANNSSSMPSMPVSRWEVL